MLHFRSETVWLALCPDQVGGVRIRRGHAEVLEPVCYQAASGEAPLAALLEAVRGWLERHAVARQRVNVLLSDRLVRYALLPFSAMPLSEQEEAALLGARFEELYGEMPQWRVQADRPEYGKARIACAMPLALADGVAGLLAGAGARSGAVLPFFVACWNRWRRQGAGRDGLVAVVEPEHMVIGSFGAGGWSSLRSVFAATSEAVVADLVFREKIMQGLDPALPVSLLGMPPGATAQPASVAMALMGAGR
ncbi:hypothetical protein ACFDR9_005496 [Janthinobacterium sp. CG_23.3]|uniref:hypothetical protein n=1 Tax=Janthinobacterium sp. CG_23.3 TaxID=3349634 RepID=UPI0038D47625